jgi:hypothetical protein
MMKKFAEPFRFYVPFWSNTKGTSCTKSIPSVLSLTENHWGNPFVSTYSMKATSVTFSPFSQWVTQLTLLLPSSANIFWLPELQVSRGPVSSKLWIKWGSWYNFIASIFCFESVKKSCTSSLLNPINRPYLRFPAFLRVKLCFLFKKATNQTFPPFSHSIDFEACVASIFEQKICERDFM